MLITQVDSVPDPELRVFRPIQARIERLDSDNFVATAPEVDIHASGETEGESLFNLGDMIAATFGHFSAVPRDRLGPIPARQLRVLQQHVRRR